MSVPGRVFSSLPLRLYRRHNPLSSYAQSSTIPGHSRPQPPSRRRYATENKSSKPPPPASPNTSPPPPPPPSQPKSSSAEYSAAGNARMHTSKVKLRNHLGVSSPSRILEIPLSQALFRGVVFVLVGAGLVLYLREERARYERKKIANATKGIGKPKVGGPFELIDQDGRKFGSEDLAGKYALLYFGYTRCPDICPDELDKMSEMIDTIKGSVGDVILPIMISCDPLRDPPELVKKYLEDFHPDIIGLTGTYDDIKQTCKVYRVYFSTPPKVTAGEDYLVDHSIYFFLMDPEGDFVEVLGRNFTAKEASKVVIDHVRDWDGFLDRSPRIKGAGISKKVEEKTVTK